MPISFAPRPPQGGQRSQDLSSKAATESLPLVLVDEQEICQREKHLLALDSCRRIFLQISPKFPRAGLAAPLRDEKRDSSLEQIRSAFSHSDDLRRLATFSCKKISSFPTRLSDPHLPPQAGGLLKSALQEPVLPLPPTSQWDPPTTRLFYLPRGARCPRRETGAEPAFGKLIIGRGVLPRKFCAQAPFRLHLLLMGFGVVLTPGHH